MWNWIRRPKDPSYKIRMGPRVQIGIDIEKAVMITQDLKVRKLGHDNQWCAGFWEEGSSPSCASGDVGFYGSTPEEAVKNLLTWLLIEETEGE